jgi:hypothetical protein
MRGDVGLGVKEHLGFTDHETDTVGCRINVVRPDGTNDNGKQ